jgi:CRISPR-associated protein Cas2
MMVLVTYDVNTESNQGKRRLQHISKLCQNYGVRVQNSVFECLVDPAQWTELRQKLIDMINTDKDSLRFYYLGKNWRRRVKHVGAKETYDPEGPLVV